MFRSIVSTAVRLKRDERGHVAMMFGLTIIMISMCVGLAFDYGRATSARAKIANAADAAALAAAKGMRLEGLTDAEADLLGQKVFAENMKNGAGNWTDIHSVVVTLNRAEGSALITVDASVKTTFAAISGITQMIVPRAASAIFESKDIEVSVQLDLTGSMCSPCSKITALKTATKNLVDILVPDTPGIQKVRVGLAPFSAGVNVGSYLTAVDGNRSVANTCVYERQSPTNALTDVEPLGLDAFKIRSDLTGAVQPCPAAKIVPLTNDKITLKAAVDTFNAVSSTAGQLGAAWAWYLISPTWDSIWPAASKPASYGDTRTEKVVILMTDGVYNTIGGINYGDTSAQATTASNMSVDICTNMKEKNITIYTVGFDFNSISNSSARQRAIDTLTGCAGKKDLTDKTGYFFQADDGDALEAAFRNIANNIIRLRLAS